MNTMHESSHPIRGHGRLVGVGVGPGDPELVTTKAIRVIRESDHVVAPSTAPDAIGRAEAIVREAAPGTPIDRVCFDMSVDAEATCREIAATVLIPRLRQGLQVAFVTIGDPNMYSTFSSVATAVRSADPCAAIDTVPGIMAFQALAAKSDTVLLDGVESLTLLTALDGMGPIQSALSCDQRAVVIYKGGRNAAAIRSCIESSGRLEGAVAGELLGLPGERVVAARELDGCPASYLSTVIVPPGSRIRQAE